MVSSQRDGHGASGRGDRGEGRLKGPQPKQGAVAHQRVMSETPVYVWGMVWAGRGGEGGGVYT